MEVDELSTLGILVHASNAEKQVIGLGVFETCHVDMNDLTVN